MEKYEGGELFSKLEQEICLTPSDAQCITRQMFMAIQYFILDVDNTLWQLFVVVSRIVADLDLLSVESAGRVRKGPNVQHHVYRCSRSSVLRPFLVTNVNRYIHSLQIIHRDIKPENWLFSKPDSVEGLKLIDFGLAKIITDASKKLSAPCGTLHYVAPETLGIISLVQICNVTEIRHLEDRVVGVHEMCL